jgi:hypothetical protein
MCGRHPDIAPDQHGATAHRIGLRAKALAHILHYAHGVPVRRTPAILEELTGLRLTQGAITQDALRQSQVGGGAHYEQLRAARTEPGCGAYQRYRMAGRRGNRFSDGVCQSFAFGLSDPASADLYF